MIWRTQLAAPNAERPNQANGTRVRVHCKLPPPSHGEWSLFDRGTCEAQPKGTNMQLHPQQCASRQRMEGERDLRNGANGHRAKRIQAERMLRAQATTALAGPLDPHHHQEGQDLGGLPCEPKLRTRTHPTPCRC